MWKYFFQICWFLSFFIPNKQKRQYIREVKLHNWKPKYLALIKAYPELRYKHYQIIKGGWNIGFIIGKKYVFKIRKSCEHNIPVEKIIREKRITDALRDTALPIQIPNIEIVNADKYTFVKYNFIKGINMNIIPKFIIKHFAKKWGYQLGEFIYNIHSCKTNKIDDLKTTNGDGWNHNDICNNVIINVFHMRVVGVIDWEYSQWDFINTEFRNSVAFSKKIKQSGILENIQERVAILQRTSL